MLCPPQIIIKNDTFFYYYIFYVSLTIICCTHEWSNGQDESEWPPIPVLPSYGTGRDAPGGRLSSLIFGTNLTDVVITGKYR